MGLRSNHCQSYNIPNLANGSLGKCYYEHSSYKYPTAQHHPQATYYSRGVPVENIVVGVAQFVKEISEKLPEVIIIGLVLKLQRSTEIQVGSKFTCRKCSVMVHVTCTHRKPQQHTHVHVQVCSDTHQWKEVPCDLECMASIYLYITILKLSPNWHLPKRDRGLGLGMWVSVDESVDANQWIIWVWYMHT